jgi:hypothetical protein
LSGAAPHELTAFALAVLNVYIPARIFEAAVLEHAVDEHSFVQHQVLILKRFAFIAIH